MAFVELGPMTSRLVQAVGGSVDRLKPRNPHKISFEVLDRIGFAQIGANKDDLPPSTALKPTERAEVDNLQRLRGAIYADKAR